MISGQTKKKRRTKIGLFQGVLDGSLLSNEIVGKHYKFILYITFLILLYIYNRYSTENVIRQITKTQKEIKELRSESISIASELMYLSNQTEVSKLLKKNGIKLMEPIEPPRIIMVDKKTVAE